MTNKNDPPLPQLLVIALEVRRLAPWRDVVLGWEIPLDDVQDSRVSKSRDSWRCYVSRRGTSEILIEGRGNSGEAAIRDLVYKLEERKS